MRAIMPLWIIAAGFRISFVVFPMASAAGQPGEGSFHNPPFGKRRKLIDARRSMGGRPTFEGLGADVG
jgi:hypothetical protein